MDELNVFAGGAAFSEYRRMEILRQLQGVIPVVESIEALWVFWIDADQSVFAAIAGKVLALLGGAEPWKGQGGFFVCPRKGTVSPWSSKATDIFHNCGLEACRRVERGMHISITHADGHVLDIREAKPVLGLLHDRMTEGVYEADVDLFETLEPRTLETIPLMKQGRHALDDANVRLGLALSSAEIDYLDEAYQRLQRDPTDVELVMFGQVNSEHCRHKIFNANWTIDGIEQQRSLFDMIRHTHATHPGNTLVAYKDNAGVMEGGEDHWFEAERSGGGRFRYVPATIDMLIKVETHNHPTAIAPFPGAATGVGGEIRDECATGIGGKSKAGLSAFMVSNLRVPNYSMPWEPFDVPLPERLASPLQIMLEAPIGGAAFGNEFGRPQLCGLFRTYEESVEGMLRGYHKPIMAAGGLGSVKREHVFKHDIPVGAYVLQIGGPAMRIGLGGGAASSMGTGSNSADLDFDSVQRGNAEMERRCQEVVDGCIALGAQNPIVSVHDIGAGGLSNGCPELIAETGGHFKLRAIHNEERSMSPMEIWCCEAQERYVLAVKPEDYVLFESLCERERCPVAIIGEATADGMLQIEDDHFGNRPVDLPVEMILGKPPIMHRTVSHREKRLNEFDASGIEVRTALQRVLQLPAVADKRFLITIADRSVTGLVARDQMVGPWQTPIADAAVTTTSFVSYRGEAMAMGERTPLAILDGPASGRMAIAESLLNLAGVSIGSLELIKLSANWMCACGEAGEDAELYDTVKAVGESFCPALGVSIPVGKDSLSMKTVWDDDQGGSYRMTAPLSLIVTAFAPVNDVRLTVTADLKPEPSRLFLLDLAGGAHRLGGSALAQVYNQSGDQGPDIDNVDLLASGFRWVQELVETGLLLACHDRSDGGVIVTLCEMAFGGRCGMKLDIGSLGTDALSVLFNEEAGVVLQVAESNVESVRGLASRVGLSSALHAIGGVDLETPVIEVVAGGQEILSERVCELHRLWSGLSTRMQSLRDNPLCAESEYTQLQDEHDPGMSFDLSYEPEAPHVIKQRPPIAVLREQGVNGHVEMAAAFDRAGFESIDVHMSDLLGERVDLADFRGLVACGGFSYGDVLGAGTGWAHTILFNERLKAMFAEYFSRPETFTLGVCNGCQMVSQLKSIIPGASHWPAFVRNESEQFEARYSTVEILPSLSVLLQGMEGSRVGIAVAHGEGRVAFENPEDLARCESSSMLSMRYVDHDGRATERYPLNPNGSEMGLTGVTSADGRVTIMMPHPERGFRSVQLSYRPSGFCQGEAGPWLRLFQNAYRFAIDAG